MIVGHQRGMTELYKRAYLTLWHTRWYTRYTIVCGGLNIMATSWVEYNTRLGGSTCHQMLKSGDPGLGAVAPPSNLHQEGRVGI